MHAVTSRRVNTIKVVAQELPKASEGRGPLTSSVIHVEPIWS
jgi:hypothetical protein